MAEPGLLLNLLSVGVVAVLTGAANISLPAAAGLPQSAPKDFESTTLGDTAFIEWAAFSGVKEHLDGPAREGMIRRIGGAGLQGCNNGVNSDSAGNLYICDMESGAIRALRWRDRMLLTLSGNGLITAGGAPGKEGPAHRLRINQDITFAPVGEDVLEGKGSLYFITNGFVLRLFLNDAKGGVWWYERVAGGGKRAPGDGVDALEAGIPGGMSGSRIIPTAKGDVGIILPTGGGAIGHKVLYWLKNGKLSAAYDDTTASKAAGGVFDCYGVDGRGNIVGTNGKAGRYTKIVVLDPGGKNARSFDAPGGCSWGVFPDSKREWWFFKGGDDYTINRIKPDRTWGVLRIDGSWKTEGAEHRSAVQPPKDVVGWAFGTPLLDGRYAGWNPHGAPPLFVATWLEKE